MKNFLDKIDAFGENLTVVQFIVIAIIFAACFFILSRVTKKFE